MSDFEGLVALITGGASGIGAATAVLLQSRGARVAVLDRSTDGAPDGVLALPGDVTDSAQIERAVATVVEEFGGLDVLVNNAGIGAAGDVSQNDDAEWARVLDVNVTGIARVTRSALPHLRRSNHASVVNTCSVVAFIGLRQRALYGASKGAVLALTLAMAADHITEGIRVNAVAPGPVWTPLNPADSPPDKVAQFGQDTDFKRPAQPEELSPAYVFLAAPACASYITGIVLPVTGKVGAI